MQTSAGNNLVLIRDTEIENTIRAFIIPVLLAAGLKPKAVKVYIIKNNALNAFVAGGQKIFINSGLIIKSSSATEIIGVLAHEIGHIAGGHLSRTRDALSRSSSATILSYLLGGAATLATKRSDLGTAIVAAGRTVGMQSFLNYSRTQENAADHAALKYLDATKHSADGLLKFMERLNKIELLTAYSQDLYLRTHPLSKDRIETIKKHIATSPYKNSLPSKFEQSSHARIKAKLAAFLKRPDKNFSPSKTIKKSITAQYAQAITFHKNGYTEPAIKLINDLILKDPRNPYFYQLKGQFQFESGHLRKALKSLNSAIRLLPDAPLFRLLTAQIQLEMNDQAFLNPAIANLKFALTSEPASPSIWRSLAIAYGKKGEIGNKSLALAEESFLIGKFDIAKYHAGRAESLFPNGSRKWLHSQDILAAILNSQRKTKSNKAKK